jgi:Protein of unknown function DUF45
MTTKWASFSTTGRLTFDASLLELREELQNYVIAHELLHFHAPNHGKLWKTLMRAHLGEYEQRLAGEFVRVDARDDMGGSRQLAPGMPAESDQDAGGGYPWQRFPLLYDQRDSLTGRWPNSGPQN